MNVGFAVLAALQLLTSIVLLALVWRMRGRLQVLRKRLKVAPALEAEALPPGPRISVEILNPFELAVRETPLAGPAAQLAPRVIERIVYHRTVEALNVQLREQGVDAKVSVHGLA